MNVRKASIFVLGLAFIASTLLVVAFLQIDSTRTEKFLRIEEVSGAETSLAPFLSNQVTVRESMVSGLRSNDIDAFCNSYEEFVRIAKEEPLVPEGPEESILVIGEGEGWAVRLLMIDWYLIPDLVQLSGLCEEEG